MSDTRSTEVVDLRHMIPPQRHATVFAHVDELEPGESFVLINDHDPLGLRHRLDIEHPGKFAFDYLISGPDEWQVAIARR